MTATTNDDNDDVDDGNPSEPILDSCGKKRLRKLQKIFKINDQSAVQPQQILRIQPNLEVNKENGDYLTLQFSNTLTGQVLCLSRGAYEQLMTSSLQTVEEYIERLEMESQLNELGSPPVTEDDDAMHN